jgi:hypothetical protein
MAREALCLLDTVNYREAYGIHASILFNRESPIRGATFVKITRGVAAIAWGLQSQLFPAISAPCATGAMRVTTWKACG